MYLYLSLSKCASYAGVKATSCIKGEDNSSRQSSTDSHALVHNNQCTDYSKLNSWITKAISPENMEVNG